MQEEWNQPSWMRPKEGKVVQKEKKQARGVIFY
jgi:hypothetical protein